MLYCICKSVFGKDYNVYKNIKILIVIFFKIKNVLKLVLVFLLCILIK